MSEGIQSRQDKKKRIYFNQTEDVKESEGQQTDRREGSHMTSPTSHLAMYRDKSQNLKLIPSDSGRQVERQSQTTNCIYTFFSASFFDP